MLYSHDIQLFIGISYIYTSLGFDSHGDSLLARGLAGTLLSLVSIEAEVPL